MMDNLNKIRAEVLIIGGGGAGCRAAIESASMGTRVVLASKYPIGKSGATVVAENFYVAPFGNADPQDSPENYFQDIIQGGSSLSDQSLVQRLVNDGCDRVLDLERYGVRFKKEASGKFIQMKGPGHTFNRALSPVGGGLGIIRGLQQELKKYDQVQLLEDVIITKILTNSGAVAGALGLDIRTGHPILIESKAIVLATGGYSHLWSYNDVPRDCTGDGLAMAYHAGADLIDLEMVLFYPTVIIHPPSVQGVLLPHGILLEQVKAKILNGRFDEFLPEKVPTRDVMNSLIYSEVSKGNGTPHGGVFLDVSRSPFPKEEIKERLMAHLPEKYKYLLKYGIDIAQEPLEVAPMAHYSMGGLRINSECQTGVQGLYGAGEVEGNVHGANRLGGNALPETQVFGAKAGEKAAQWAMEYNHLDWDPQEVSEEIRSMLSLFDLKINPICPSQIKKELQDLMWSHVGPLREGTKLKEAIAEIARIKETCLPRLTIPQIREFNLQWVDALEVRHMFDLSEMIAKAALLRTETRGHHSRLDFPEKDDQNWLRHIILRKEGGEMRLWTEPVGTIHPTN
jgi:succinate dehydrogenase/fumarate reductase flavoprotein subunit